MYLSRACVRTASFIKSCQRPSSSAATATTQSESGQSDRTSESNIDDDLIRHLERTSLVDFESKEALTRLEEAVRFAQTIFEVDTKGVEPMTSVLEDRPLRLREDRSVKTNRNDIVCNATLTEEDYFVSPPGNIPLEPKSKSFAITAKKEFT